MVKNLAKRLQQIEQAALTAATDTLHRAINIGRTGYCMSLQSRSKIEQEAWRKLAREIITKYNETKAAMLGD